MRRPEWRGEERNPAGRSKNVSKNRMEKVWGKGQEGEAEGERKERWIESKAWWRQCQGREGALVTTGKDRASGGDW